LIITSFNKALSAERDRHDQAYRPAQSGNKFQQLRRESLAQTQVTAVLEAMYYVSYGSFKYGPGTQHAIGRRVITAIVAEIAASIQRGTA
jgi:hypothetical protein